MKKRYVWIAAAALAACSTTKFTKEFTMYLTLFFSLILMSCAPEETPCTETVCPEGFNNCFEQPCDY